MTTMDFFGHQDQARRHSKHLVLLFAAAVLCIVLLVYAAAVVLLNVTDTSKGFWQPEALVLVAGAVLLLVGLAAAFRTSQLKSGGSAVAEMLGGREVEAGGGDHKEQQLYNVVEEMAIASGVPMPRVYVLDNEAGMNAFAAGWSPRDAAVTVTRGLLEQLDRDQLQGVVAHEFSHVFHGDMRLNIRLMGTLFGILCLTVVGRILLRVGGSGRSNNKGGGAGVALFGLALLAIGGIGVLFARLIQAAISRQREFLADASAVQYTRNPRGIGTALAKIGGLGSRLQNPHAQEASHFFFASGVKQSFTSLMATHPPIVDRVERVLPGFKQRWQRETGGNLGGMAAMAAAMAPPPEAAIAGIAGIAGAAPRGIGPTQLLASVGAPQQQHVEHARALMAELPLELLAAAREPLRARALVSALLLDADATRREAQLQLLAGRGDALAYDTRLLHGLLLPLATTTRLPLLELAVPSLRRLPAADIAPLHQDLRALAMADGKLTPFEFLLLKTVERHVRRRDVPPQLKPPRPRQLSTMAPAAAVVLSVLARHGRPGEEATAASFQSGARALPGMTVALQSEAACSLQALDAAIDELDATSPLGKRMLLTACAQVIGSDGVIEPDEAELLRAVAEHWGCPVPPTAATAG